jgi:APA family basic amino acid/polyamine antiporter
MWLATVLTMAVAAIAVPGQLAEFVPELARHDAEVACGVAVVLALGAANTFDIRAGSLTSNAFAILKIAPLVLLAVVGVLAVRGGSLTPFAPHGLSAIGPALLPVIFALTASSRARRPPGWRRIRGGTCRVPFSGRSSARPSSTWRSSS